MGNWRRIFHNGSIIRAVEHRADEHALGASAYTDANIPDIYLGFDWFVDDINKFHDGEGAIPWEAISVTNPEAAKEQRQIGVDGTITIAARQHAKNATRGAQGRLDELTDKLQNDTISDAELRELLKLERGL